MSNTANEVRWGESQEAGVAKLWAVWSEQGREARNAVKSQPFDPYDYIVFGKDGTPLCCLEVKVRRVKFGTYGDVMAPLKKHEYALDMQERLIDYFLVTLYADGTLVQVDLSEKPAKRLDVARRDRPGMKAQPHGLWSGDSVLVLREATE